MEGFWGIVLIAGPILLIAAVIYGTIRNRKASGGSQHQADAGARRLQEDIENRPNRDIDI